MNFIRVLVVDDHPMVRRGLKSLLSAYPDMEVVGEAKDGAEALRMAETFKPDVILLDILMPGPDGIEVVSHLSHNGMGHKVIMLTAFDNQDYVMGALRGGAFAYLLKSAADETLVDTIRSVSQGKHIVAPELMDPVLQQVQVLAQTHAEAESGLSNEELKVLSLIADGATNEDIAGNMFWSERTVKRKVEEISSKLNAKNRTQAVAEAIKRGLIW